MDCAANECGQDVLNYLKSYSGVKTEVTLVTKVKSPESVRSRDVGVLCIHLCNFILQMVQFEVHRTLKTVSCNSNKE